MWEHGKIAVQAIGIGNVLHAPDRCTQLMVLGVCPAAYYLDVQNRRPEYIKTFTQSLINWNKVLLYPAHSSGSAF